MKDSIKIIIISVCLILIGVIIYSLAKQKPNIIPNIPIITTKPEEEDKELTKLKKYFTSYGLCETGIELDFSSKKEYTVEDLSETNIYHLITNYLMVNNLVTETNETKSSASPTVVSYKLDDLKTALQEMFGEEYSANWAFPNQFNVRGTTFTLDNDVYKGIIPNNGCMEGTYASFKSADSYIDGDSLNINYILYYPKTEIIEEQNTFRINAYKYKNDSEPICLKSEVEEKQDEFRIYTFTFNKVGNNYIFKSIKEAEN